MTSKQDARLDDRVRELNGWSEPANNDVARMLWLGKEAAAFAIGYRAECQALRAERDEARKEAAEWKRNAEVVESAANAWTDEATKLEAQLEEARVALREFGRHAPPCRSHRTVKARGPRWLVGDELTCDCGLSAALSISTPHPRGEAAMKPERLEEIRAAVHDWPKQEWRLGYCEITELLTEVDALTKRVKELEVALAGFEKKLATFSVERPDGSAATVEDFMRWVLPMINGFGNDARAALLTPDAGEKR